MEIFGIALTIISLILAYQAWQNGKLMKQMHVESMAMIKSIKELNEAIKEDIRISTQETRALLERIQKGQEEARKEMASAIKYIAELIVADGERTRELLRAKGRV
ncbi:MAG: hypothetical protein ACK44H_05570 [Candidatus Kryptonium sp.]